MFKRVFNSFLDKYSRDVMFRIVHEILPVGYIIYLEMRNVYSVNLLRPCLIYLSIVLWSNIYLLY